MATLQEALAKNEENNDYLAQGVIEAYFEMMGDHYLKSEDVDNVLLMIEDAYVGEYFDGEEFAIEMCGDDLPNDLPDYIKSCVDWQQVWDGWLSYDYTGENGFFFRNH